MATVLVLVAVILIVYVFRRVLQDQGEGVRLPPPRIRFTDIPTTRGSIVTSVTTRPAPRVVIRPLPRSASSPVLTVRPTHRVQPRTVRPVQRPYWELQHWRFNGSALVGFYRTPFGSYAGRIENARSRNPSFYIFNPPGALRGHPHWICFHHKGNGRYWIHFSPAPPTPDAGILEVEKVLAEALSRRRSS